MKNQEIDKLYIELGKHYKKRYIKQFASDHSGLDLIVLLAYSNNEKAGERETSRRLEERHKNIIVTKKNKPAGPRMAGTYRSTYTTLKQSGIFERYFPQIDRTIPITLRLPESLHIRLKARSTEKDISINKLINTAIKRTLRQ